jgi:hypothetical protein
MTIFTPIAQSSFRAEQADFFFSFRSCEFGVVSSTLRAGPDFSLKASP